LYPFHNNFGKRYIKSPKIYFTDTGLACYLLGIKDEEALSKHYLIGGLFENLCIMDIYKKIYNGDSRASLYFYRDSNNSEVDLIIDTGAAQIPIEIKSGATFTQSYAKGIKYWRSIRCNSKNQPGFIIYAGDDRFANDEFSLVNWRSMSEIKF
jgi:predicted AAA+ superfamily ATPase